MRAPTPAMNPEKHSKETIGGGYFPLTHIHNGPVKGRPPVFPYRGAAFPAGRTQHPAPIFFFVEPPKIYVRYLYNITDIFLASLPFFCHLSIFSCNKLFKITKNKRLILLKGRPDDEKA